MTSDIVNDGLWNNTKPKDPATIIAEIRKAQNLRATIRQSNLDDLKLGHSGVKKVKDDPPDNGLPHTKSQKQSQSFASNSDIESDSSSDFPETAQTKRGKSKKPVLRFDNKSMRRRVSQLRVHPLDSNSRPSEVPMDIKKQRAHSVFGAPGVFGNQKVAPKRSYRGKVAHPIENIDPKVRIWDQL